MFNILAGSVQGSNYEHFIESPVWMAESPRSQFLSNQYKSSCIHRQSFLSLSKATDVGISTKGAPESEDFLMVVLRLIK